MVSFNDKINQIGIQAKEASKILAKVSTKQKNEALLAMANHILKDKELPQHLPIVRLTGTDLSTRMREYVVLHVLRLHRRLPEVEESQKTEEWNQIIEPPANNRTVGIMGLGNLGADCAQILSKIGFNVLGWAKSKKALEGVESFVGNSGFDTFLSKSDIVVCMLPLTPETTDIMNASFFNRL